MYMITLKVFNRKYDNDKSYYITKVLIYDSELGKWLSKPKTFSREIIDYSYC